MICLIGSCDTSDSKGGVKSQSTIHKNLSNPATQFFLGRQTISMHQNVIEFYNIAMKCIILKMSKYCRYCADTHAKMNKNV